MSIANCQLPIADLFMAAVSGNTSSESAIGN